MISCLLLVLSVGSALAGVSIQMPYLNPAGVTYTTLPRAVPAIPAHLQYSAATTSSVAYGNAAFLGRALTHTAVPYAAAPVAHYAPVAHVAAPVVPTVHHVPAVAQVPVTKYEAQPAFVQNLVDVAKPKLATRKIEIRRPAIQKEFYDVEERVVIRPAGSAVVELDQPVSKSQKGPTVVQPAVHAVGLPHAFAAVRAGPVVGFRSLHHHVFPAAYPLAPVHAYPIHAPAFASPISTPEPPQEAGSAQEPDQQQPQQLPEQIPQQPEQLPQQQFEEQQNPQQFAPQFPQQQFDDSDSVAIENPDIARARAQQPQSQESEQTQQPQGRAQITPRIIQQQQEIIAEFQARMQERADRQQDIARSQVAAQEQVVARLQAQAESQQSQLQRSQQLLQVQQQVLERSRQAVANSFTRSQPTPAQPELQARYQPEQEEGLPSVGPAPERTEVRASVEAADLRSALINNLARSSQSPNVIPSVRISPEQSISNQEQLISLLTARGGVVEARSAGSSGESHKVRARVLSVTPAPDNAAPRDEKVNTRRIVVSRPIHTVEEVDVVEPFTKIERVAVHSPAVIKTARVGVAHVPASLPVHGYAHAVTAAPIAVY